MLGIDDAISIAAGVYVAHRWETYHYHRRRRRIERRQRWGLKPYRNDAKPTNYPFARRRPY